MVMVHANRNDTRAGARTGAGQGHSRLGLVDIAGVTLRLDHAARGLG